jgi:hypothetical protein
MIDFSKYINEWAVLITNFTCDPQDLYGISIIDAKVFKYHNKWVIVRKLTLEDVRNEDFVDWMNSMWNRDEAKLKLFLRYKHEELSHDETTTYCTAVFIATSKN